MSTAAKGWYVDPSTGTNLRYWNGTTWTDDVAALPDGAPHLDPFAAVEQAIAEQVAAEQAAAEQAAAEAAAVQAGAEVEATDAADHPPLDPELEHTQLTRRQLRARRGTESERDDTPKHLSRLAPLPEYPQAEQPEAERPGSEQPALEELEPEHPPQESEPDNPRRRRTSIIRLSVLLGILAVASSVAVLTAGTL